MHIKNQSCPADEHENIRTIMNQQNAKDFLPLVQALANGLTIQEDMGKDGWKDFEELHFDMRPEFYRIKPKPRTFDLWLDNDTGCLTTDELIRDFGHVRLDSLEQLSLFRRCQSERINH